MLTPMAKDSAVSGRAEKRAAKKATRAERREARRERWRQIRMAFQITRQRDPKLVWLLIAYALGTFAVIFVGLFLLGVFWPIALVLGLLTAAMVGMIIFGRRAQKAAFREVEGQPGAAAWVLQNMRGNWRITPAVAGNTQLDAIHRVLGRPGIILIGEGAEHRVKGLLAQEKKRVARVAGDTPIYDVTIGTDEEQVTLRKLQQYMMKLPRNLTPAQVNAMEKRLQALGGAKVAMPKGPMPKNARNLTGIQRTIRRR
jgi:hypothetical protein